MAKANHSEIWVGIGGKCGRSAAAAKAAYMAGLLRHTVEAAGKLLAPPHQFWLPAMSLALNAAEAVGHYRSAGATPTDRLDAALRHLVGDAARRDFAALRNFALHGAVAAESVEFDQAMVKTLLAAIADEALKLDDPDPTILERLDRTRITPLMSLGVVVFVDEKDPAADTQDQ